MKIRDEIARMWYYHDGFCYPYREMVYASVLVGAVLCVGIAIIRAAFGV